jgi:adenylylsulfate kinase
VSLGAIVWFTGLPSSGKSTLAQAVAAALRASGRESVVVLDGDDVRHALRPEPGYDPLARDAFYETLARLAALLAAQGLLVLVPATAHARAFRDRARALAPGRFHEVFVDTPEAECRRRDSKGLYARADRAANATLPGAGIAFESPTAPALVVHPGDTDAAARVVALLSAE